MIYFVLLIVLFVIELIYFKIANYYNIIDKPNERSSHTSITLRGGGVIFYISALIYFIWSGFSYPFFFIGLTLMTLISFLDDIFTLSNRLRLLIHFISVLLMVYEMNIFSMQWYYLVLTFVFVVGVINAYNFMDGINGITACYSLSILGLLAIVNKEVNFIDNDLIIFVSLGVLVFAFFNFRYKAKAFAGDVGSVSIAFIILFILGTLIIKTGDFIYIFFLLIYGIDSVWTIVRRLIHKENIFEAHRTHLYQYLGNEAKFDRLLISFVYGFLQFLIGLGVIYLTKFSTEIQLISLIILVIIVSLIYLFLKTHIIRKYT